MYLIHRNKCREPDRGGARGICSKQKEQDKTSQKVLNEMEISNLSDKEHKTMVIMMLTELGKRTDNLKEDFNKGTENIKMNQSELKNTTGNENTIEAISKLEDAEERISELEDRVVESDQAE